MTFLVAAAAIVLAIGMLRGLLGDRALPSLPALAAVGAAMLLTFHWLGNVDSSLEELHTKYDQFAPLNPRDALENTSTQVGIDSNFNAWAAGNMKRGETFAVLRPYGFGADRWLAYRLVPNTLARRREDADWLFFFRTPDPYAKHGLRPEDYARLSWGPDAGMLRRLRAG